MNYEALFLADVDGTLTTPEKIVTPRAAQAIRSLYESGVAFSIVSGRPPRGLKNLVSSIDLRIPFAAFNGGALLDPDFSIRKKRALAPDTVEQVLEVIHVCGLDAWIYTERDWFLRDLAAPYVEKETRTVQFSPIVVKTFDPEMIRSAAESGILKVVGVSSDFEKVMQLEIDLQQRFKGKATASRSQPYYVDVTHPLANKGIVLQDLCDFLKISPERAITIGDMPNDVRMFKLSGFSIAMGNSGDEVKKAADLVTLSNQDEGFATAVEYVISAIRARKKGAVA